MLKLRLCQLRGDPNDVQSITGDSKTPRIPFQILPALAKSPFRSGEESQALPGLDEMLQGFRPDPNGFSDLHHWDLTRSDKRIQGAKGDFETCRSLLAGEKHETWRQLCGVYGSHTASGDVKRQHNAKSGTGTNSDKSKHTKGGNRIAK